MKHLLFTTFISLLILAGCSVKKKNTGEIRIRNVVDTVGFAHNDWQMDSVKSRIDALFQEKLINVAQSRETPWRLAICPHDDYTYASWLYPAVLKNIKAKTAIIFGVAHKARDFNLENKLIFDSFKFWSAPYKPVKVSDMREGIMNRLPQNSFIIHDSMQIVEHSVEALVPFLQYQNRHVEIVSVLIPYMDLQTMEQISSDLSYAISEELKARSLRWGEDVALLITSDAVHYGDEEWGGKNYAPYGTDSLGYLWALEHENEIIDTCFVGALTQDKAEKFFRYTVSGENYKEYIWPWCGRYCIPMGMKTAGKLSMLLNEEPLTGIKIGYSTSIGQKHVPVHDLGMGTTAIATPHHWVGYPAIGFY